MSICQPIAKIRLKPAKTTASTKRREQAWADDRLLVKINLSLATADDAMRLLLHGMPSLTATPMRELEALERQVG